LRRDISGEGGEFATEDIGTGEAPRAGRGNQVVGHTRTGGLHSIRLRLMLPIVLAAIGLLGLGAAQTDTAIHSAVSARRAEAVANTAIVSLRVETELEQEIAEADRLRARGGAGAGLLTAAQGQTDLSVTDFRAVSAQVRRIAPDLGSVVDTALAQLATLGTIRSDVSRLSSDTLSGNRYDAVRQAVLAVADALPTALADADLAATARAVAAIASAEHYGAEQRDLLHQVFLRGSFQPGEQAQLDLLVGAQNERVSEFSRNATAQQQALYKREYAGSDVSTALAMRTAALAATPAPAALKADPDVWYITQSNLMRQMHAVQLSLSHTLDQTSRQRQAAAENQAVITGLATAALIAIAFGAALFFAVRTTRRLARLRRAALTVAGVELPDTITSLTTAPDTVAVRGVLNASAARADALSLAGSDEIGEVGAALSTVHRQALRLAADQALMRLDIAGLFVALSRRGQTLVNRQLQLIAEFERLETDPDALGRLFALDHLAARMRRNDENLLVLAGGEPGGRVMTSVPLVDVIRAASAEIEDYHRVEPVAVAEVAVAAPVVRDLIHLLAELLENSTAYSPPNSRVRVSARRTIDTVTVTVFDEGIGIPASRVSELNARLSRSTMLTAELAGTMGLLVVARLAARHRITVELRSAQGGGTAALVALPIEVLAPVPVGRPEQWGAGAPSVAEVPYAVRTARQSAGWTASRAVSGPGAGGPAPVAAVPAGRGAAGPALVGPAPVVAVPASGNGVVPASGNGVVPAGAGFGSMGATAPGFATPPGYGPGGAQPAVAPPGEWPPRPPAAATTPPNAGMDLPRRRPGILLAPGHAGAARPAEDDPSRPPDPDAIRARLSGLASGMAAAARHNSRPPA
jgi:signal transduction histidine kinase